MNFGHLVTLPGILKLVALIACLLAASIGSAAFVTSAYNKSCGDGTVESFIGNPPQSTEPGGSSSSEITTFRTRYTGSPSSSTTSMTSTSTFISTASSTLTPPSVTSSSEGTTPEEYKDMAPVLWMERFQISTAWLALIISIVLLVLYVLMEDLEYNKFFKAANFTFHFIFCVLLILSAIFLAFAAVEIDRQICEGNFDKREDCQKYMQKMSAAAFSLLTAVLYGVICVKVIATKLYEEV